MELRHLRYFIAVAEEKSISRAAERLHLSQPPLTRQIQLLEQKVGTRLFDRSSTGVALTAAGRFFLEDARLILAMVTQAEERAQSAGLGQIGRIDIAVFGSVMFDDLPQLLARFRDTHPRVEVVLHTLNKGDQIEALRQHRITIGFNRLTSNFTDIATTRLKAERLVIALHHSHPLAARKRLSLADLEGCPLVLFSSGPRPNFTDLIFALFQQLGLKPVVSQTVEDSVTGVALVAAGFGACLVPGSVSHVKLPGVVFIPLTKIPAGIVDLNCMYRKDDTSPITMAFLETLKAFRSPIVDSVSH